MTRTNSTVPLFVSLLLAVTACGHGAGEPAEPAPAAAAPAPEATPAVAPGPSAAEAPSAAPEAPPVASAVPIASAAPEPAPSAAPPAPESKAGKSKGTALPAAPVASASAAPAGDAPAADACTTKNFHYSQIGAACRKGGRKAAKEIMKGAVTKAKAAGTDLKCTSCHTDMTSFQLKGNAVSDLKQWL